MTPSTPTGRIGDAGAATIAAANWLPREDAFIEDTYCFLRVASIAEFCLRDRGNITGTVACEHGGARTTSPPVPSYSPLPQLHKAALAAHTHARARAPISCPAGPSAVHTHCSNPARPVSPERDSESGSESIGSTAGRPPVRRRKTHALQGLQCCMQAFPGRS